MAEFGVATGAVIGNVPVLMGGGKRGIEKVEKRDAIEAAMLAKG